MGKWSSHALSTPRGEGIGVHDPEPSSADNTCSVNTCLLSVPSNQALPPEGTEFGLFGFLPHPSTLNFNIE